MYAVINYCENGKYYAHAWKITPSNNFLTELSRLGGDKIKSVNIYPTKKAAAAVVEDWNACYKRNGTNLF